MSRFKLLTIAIVELLYAIFKILTFCSYFPGWDFMYIAWLNKKSTPKNTKLILNDYMDLLFDATVVLLVGATVAVVLMTGATVVVLCSLLLVQLLL